MSGERDKASENPLGPLRRPRFRITHLLGLITIVAVILAATTQLGYVNAEIEIVEFSDSFGYLEAIVQVKLPHGGGGGNFSLPYRHLTAEDVSELVGARLPTRFRARKTLWMDANTQELIRAELCSAIDELQVD